MDQSYIYICWGGEKRGKGKSKALSNNTLLLTILTKAEPLRVRLLDRAPAPTILA